MRACFFAVLSAAVLAGPVAAQSPAPADTPAGPPVTAARPPTTTAKLDPDRIVCRNIIVTGSRLSKRRKCRTAREWAAANAANQQSVRDLQRPGGLDSNEVFGSARAPGDLSAGRPR